MILHSVDTPMWTPPQTTCVPLRHGTARVEHTTQRAPSQLVAMETTLTYLADLQGIPPGDGSQASLKSVNDGLTKQVGD